MSDEEATNILKDIQENYKYGIKHSSSSTADELSTDIQNSKAIETILKLIENQDKKIKELNSIVDELSGIKENKDGSIDVYID